MDSDCDINWVDYFGDEESLGRSIGEKVTEKGWCTVKTDIPNDSCTDAFKQATTTLRGFDALKEELVPDFQGKSSHGKVAFLPPEQAGYREDTVSMLDQDLTSLSSAIASVSEESLGMSIVDRYPGMIWVPFGSKKEERMFAAESLTEDDVEEGVIERHILFLMRRRLCIFHMVHNEGGDISLIARDGSSLSSANLKMSSNVILIFKSGEFSLNYEPSGQHLALATWTLGPDPRSEIDMVQQVPLDDPKAASKVLGIVDGFPLPVGDRTHVMSIVCRYPGNSLGLDAYWNFFLSGGDGYVPISKIRWDIDYWCTASADDRIPGKCYARHGGFCNEEHIYTFDREFFDLPHAEAKFMAPQQKVALEDGYTVLNQAGYDRKSLSGKAIGYFCGDTGSDWQMNMGEKFDSWPQGHFCTQPFEIRSGTRPEGEYLEAIGAPSPFAMTGSNNAALCGRLSNMYNLTGPIGTVDTACSSSLVATGIAMSYLRKRDGNLEDVIVNRYRESVCCGVATQIGPFSYIGMCALSMISAMGRCFTFDQSGDGYARGEGVGSIFIKANDNADDTLNQLAAFLASAINQDGRSASMTAPNGPSQTAAIKASMLEARVHASDIALAECHGTGTALGDPIEVGALRAAMEPRDTVLMTASAKCHIGHLEGGAGMGGIAKCIAMLQSAMGSPNVQLKELNPNLSVSGFPIIFETEGVELGVNSSLTGVSSFGFGGTNGRSDLWGVCRVGSRAAGEIDPYKIAQIVATCPITNAPIDYLTGEPARDGKITRPQLADCLRDEFADYNLSRQVYTGGFRYRADAEEDEEEDELKEGTVAYLCGSWSGFTIMEEMVPDSKGTYVGFAKLGETRCEAFRICLNKKKSETIFPAVDNAHAYTYVKGPGSSSGECWLIDGRDEEIRSGTGYKITLKMMKNRKEVFWEVADVEDSASDFVHQYYVVGTFSQGSEIPMNDEGGGTWSHTFRISDSTKEDFYFLRDSDPKQAIYPAVSTSKPGPAACGPDNLGKGKFWFVRGPKDEEVTLKLKLVDGKLTVTLSGEAVGTQIWTNELGWKRHSYMVSGSFTAFKPLPMTMESPGVFTASIPGQGNLIDSFKVLVDGDPTQAFAPAKGDVSTSGAHAAAVPGVDKPAEGKFVAKVAFGSDIQVTLNLLTLDRRKTVTWSIMSSAKALAA